mgnify:CR=1 FL=1
MSSLRSAECWPWGSAVGWAWIPDPTPPGPGLPDSRPLSFYSYRDTDPACADPACADPGLC